MPLDFTGRVAVVTGAGKGIGAAVTRGLLDAGARVVAGSRHASTDLGGLAAHDVLAVVDVDLTTPDGPAHLVATATERFGGLDVLVNNMGGLAGGGPRFGGFLSVTDSDWSSSIELNLLSAIRAVRAAVPALLARGGGAIVNVSSVNAFLPDPSVVDYAASKAALTNRPTLGSRCPRSSGHRASGSTPSPLGRCAPRCGPRPVASGTSSAVRWALTSTAPCRRWPTASVVSSSDGWAPPRRLPTSSCSSPARPPPG